MRYFTSDTHFSHANIIRYSNRPFKDVSHMNEAIIANWNSVVGPEDEVYHLGDVALGPKEDWEAVFKRLNGYKILVVGNHDALFKGNKEAYRNRHGHLYNAFDEVYDNIRDFDLGGMKVNLSHFPYDGDSHDGDRYTDYRLEDRGTVLIHGHTHAEFDKMGRSAMVSYSKANTLQIHVGMDAWSYTPVSEDQIITLIESEHDYE